MLKRLTERGDTIVEVLISIAVVSLILGGAYVTTNRSLQSSRASQERTNGTKLVEGQLEAIKDLANTTPAAVFNGPSPFCINLSDETVKSGTCTVNANGGSVQTGEPSYRLSVVRTNTNTFTITNTWDRVGSGTPEKIVMTYRVYAQ